MNMIDKDVLKQRINTAFWSEIENIIDSAPSIDIVHCRECKYWNYEMSGCKRNPSVVAWRDDDFCSYGEREGE